VEAIRVIGVDLGGTKIAAGLVDRSGKVESLQEVPTPTSSEEVVVDAICETIAGLVSDEVAAIGLGVPSTIDQASGTAVSSVNIPLTDVPLRTLISERFGLPCGIDNDANAAAIGEWHAGAGKGTRDLIMLTLGTGVGGGLILDGRPYRGALGAAAELGHIVIEHDGRPCQGSCTGRGHLEAYLTGLAATADAQAVFGPDADTRVLLERANEGNEHALDILHRMGRRLGSALGSFVNVFNPEMIVIGGGWGEAAGEFLLEPAREVMLREALSPGRELVRVELATLGPDAGVVGAGFVGFEALDNA
jgi:glucokinase